MDRRVGEGEGRGAGFQKEKFLSKDLINESWLPNNFRICHLVRIRKSKEKMLRAHDILIIAKQR